MPDSNLPLLEDAVRKLATLLDEIVFAVKLQPDYRLSVGIRSTQGWFQSENGKPFESMACFAGWHQVAGVESWRRGWPL
jgi:hypothetical protein